MEAARNVQSKLDDLITDEDCLENLSDENEELQHASIPVAALASYESSTMAYGLMKSSLRETIRQTIPLVQTAGEDWMFQTVINSSRQLPLTFNQK